MTVNARTSDTELREMTVASGPVPLPAGARLQEFEVASVVGQGGFGTVYRVRDLSLHRDVAVKEYLPVQLAYRSPDARVLPISDRQADVFERGRRSFINEARMLARFSRPGLVEVLRFWEQNGTAYMAMPFYDGATLAEFVRRKPESVSEIWLKSMLRPLIDGLAAMHAEDCFHRDVSPDNILILKDGSAVLLDLGAARHVIANDVQALTVMLKPGFAPIEQYADDPQCRQGPWTDVYALAAVLYFCVTGHAPSASASRVMRDDRPFLADEGRPGYSRPFLNAIDRGLALRPEDRPKSMQQFRSMLFEVPKADRSASDARRGSVSSSAEINNRSATRDKAAPAPGTGPTPSGAVKSRRALGTVLGIATALIATVLLGRSYIIPASPATTAPAASLAEPVSGSSSLPPLSSGTAMEPSAGSLPLAAVEAQKPGSTPGSEPSDPQATAAPARDTEMPVESGSVTSETPDTTAAKSAPEGAAVAQAEGSVPEANPTVSTADKKAVPPSPGQVLVNVKPWAEIRVDGALKGVSPPLRSLSLPPGRYTIELRNPASGAIRRTIEVKPGSKLSIRHEF